MALSDPVTGEWGRLQWWPELIISIHLAAGACKVSETAEDTHVRGEGLGPAIGARANFGHTGSCGGPSCWCVLVWLLGLPWDHIQQWRLVTEVGPVACRSRAAGASHIQACE